MFALKVTDFRLFTKNSTLGFFDIEIGDKSESKFIPVFVIRGCNLGTKNEGGYFFRMPQKPRRKDGEAVKDAKGYDIYDDIVAPVWIDKKVSKATEKMRSLILAQAVKCYEEAEGNNDGRGSEEREAPKKASKPVKPAAKPKPKEPEDFPEANDDEESDLPF